MFSLAPSPLLPKIGEIGVDLNMGGGAKKLGAQRGEKQCSGVQTTTVPGPNNTRGAESKRPGVGGEKSTRLPKIGEIGVDLNIGGRRKN